MNFVNWIIERAKRTPYAHLRGYMNRYHVVPMVSAGTAASNGCGPVSPWRRPFAWVLQRFGIAIRLHEIISSDRARRPGTDRPDFHDHPWPFISVILKGGYVEHRPGKAPKFYGPGSVLFRKATDLHYLKLPIGVDGKEIPAVTLFTTLKYQQRWGFLMPDGTKMPYPEYFAKFEDLYTKEQSL
jgi:hypothetical protein